MSSHLHDAAHDVTSVIPAYLERACGSERGIEDMSAMTGMAKMMVLTADLSEESRRDLHGDPQDAAARASSTTKIMRLR